MMAAIFLFSFLFQPASCKCLTLIPHKKKIKKRGNGLHSYMNDLKGYFVFVKNDSI